MKKVTSTPIIPTTDQQPSVEVDCSRDILATMDRLPGDRVTCVRVFDDFYRCNWWSPGTSPAERTIAGLEVSTFRVRKSHFVKAAMRDGQLFVDDATQKSSLAE